VIYVLNAAADFVTGEAAFAGDDSLYLANRLNFERVSTDDPLCNPTCEVPLVVCTTRPEPVWYFLPT
jgi:hypothetical protein